MSKRIPGLINSRISCPHCSGPTHTRSSRRTSIEGEPFSSQAIRACLDPECGFTFGVAVAITHGISPSARPNAAVRLRMSAPRTWHGNDNQLTGSPQSSTARGEFVAPEVAAANDDETLSEAIG